MLVNAAIFGTVVPATYDPDVLAGWGKRFSNWEFTAGVQHELCHGCRSTSSSPGDGTATSGRWMTGPSDPRTTISSRSMCRAIQGCRMVAATLTAFDLKPAAFARAQNNFVTLSKNYGDQTEVFNAVSLGVNAGSRTDSPSRPVREPAASLRTIARSWRRCPKRCTRMLSPVTLPTPSPTPVRSRMPPGPSSVANRIRVAHVHAGPGRLPDPED